MRGGLTLQKLTKTQVIYGVSCFNLGGLELCFGGISPQKPPVATGLNWWLGLRVWCLGMCVGLGYTLQLEKENNWSLRLSQIFFTGFSYSRTVACCGYLTPNQKVLSYTTHIKNVIAKLYLVCFIPLCQTLFLYSEKQNNWQKIIGQKFRLTPGYRNLLNRTFCNRVSGSQTDT